MKTHDSTLIAIALALLVLIPALAFPFMWAWNYAVVQAITIAKPISYGVALWLMMFISVFVAGSRKN